MSLAEAALDQPEPRIPPAVAAEFDAMTRRLGIEVPAHLLRGVLLGYQGLTALAALLRAGEASVRAAEAAVRDTEASGA
jgi:hypothetical protein